MRWCEWPGHLIGHDTLERYGCRMIEGFGLTIQLVAISVTLGFILGLGLALLRLRGPAPLRRLSKGYMTFFRGTPLLCQLFLIYYGSGQFRLFWEAWGLWWFFREAYWCCLLAFTLNTTAYLAEAWRGGIVSVSKGQIEGGKALGLSGFAILVTIILPQALLVALRPIGNELIVMIKASAVASLVTLHDLMGATRLAFARSFDLTIYIYAALIYLVLVETIRRVWNRIEGRLTRHLARA
jgi:polar amino acid transport system permease protein